MKTSLCHQREQGLTLVELVVILAILIVLVIVFCLPLAEPRAPVMRVQCVNNLKQIGLATRVWEGDHEDKPPMEVSETNGGTMGFVTGPNGWRHFQVMSNELSTPKVLICPTDWDGARAWATNFSRMNNSNLSFFAGLDVSEADPQSLFSGDRNITNGTPIKNGILELTTNQPVGWTSEMHNKCGNIAVGDGHVEQLRNTDLSTAVAGTGTFTNRLQMPILGP